MRLGLAKNNYDEFIDSIGEDFYNRDLNKIVDRRVCLIQLAIWDFMKTMLACSARITFSTRLLGGPRCLIDETATLIVLSKSLSLLGTITTVPQKIATTKKKMSTQTSITLSRTTSKKTTILQWARCSVLTIFHQKWSKKSLRAKSQFVTYLLTDSLLSYFWGLCAKIISLYCQSQRRRFKCSLFSRLESPECQS